MPSVPKGEVGDLARSSAEGAEGGMAVGTAGLSARARDGRHIHALDPKGPKTRWLLTVTSKKTTGCRRQVMVQRWRDPPARSFAYPGPRDWR